MKRSSHQTLPVLKIVLESFLGNNSQASDKCQAEKSCTRSAIYDLGQMLFFL
jgi:hypothetical protein